MNTLDMWVIGIYDMAGSTKDTVIRLLACILTTLKL